MNIANEARKGHYGHKDRGVKTKMKAGKIRVICIL